MTEKYGGAFDRGDIMRRLATVEAQLRDVLTARRSEHTSIGAGGIRVHSGGGITVADGGDIQVLGGGGVQVLGGGDILLAGGGGLNVRDGGIIDIFGGQLFARAPELDRWASIQQGLLAFGRLSDNLTTGQIAGLATQLGIVATNQLAMQSGSDLFGIADGHVMFDAQDGGSMFLLAEGQIQLGSGQDQVFIDHEVDTGFPNCLIDATGRIIRDSSSRRYKQDIEDWTPDGSTILDLKPKTFRMRSDVRRDPDTTNRHLGLIAEEVDELGLTEFVIYNEDGSPESVAYDRLALGLLEVVKEQQAQLDGLTQWASTQGFTPPTRQRGHAAEHPKAVPSQGAGVRVERPAASRPAVAESRTAGQTDATQPTG